jgi:protoporphyrinogen oxidase
LGAGISGLSAARALMRRGYDPLVLEACPSPGGLSRSVKLGEFTFDYTGHLLHLARFRTPSAVPFAGLCDDDWTLIHRRSFCYFGGRLITAPIQYHLCELPPDLLAECAASYDSRPPLPAPGTGSFRDFLIGGFGRYLAEAFLIPLNEKTLATPLSSLSSAAVRRFFPAPNETVVRGGMVSGGAPPAEYNTAFWYPKQGGIEALAAGIAHGVQIAPLNKVVRWCGAQRVLRTARGSEYGWDALLSSMPLRALCLASDDPQLNEWGSQLSHSATICFNFGIRGRLAPELCAAHWIYVPDAGIPFYRVGFYSNLSAGMGPADAVAMYVEVGVCAAQLHSLDIVNELQPRVLASLQELGWIDTEAVVCSAINVIECAYVHHTPQREALLEPIMDRLHSYGIFPIGRYGLWDYTSMEDSIVSGITTVDEVLS